MDKEILANDLIGSIAKFLQTPAGHHISKIIHGELFVLNFLLTREAQGVHPKELSEKMDVSTARVSALLNNMERHGLVSRRSDGKDSRQVLVNITEAGKEYIVEKKQEVTADIMNMLEYIGQKDAGEYIRIHKKMVDALAGDKKK